LKQNRVTRQLEILYIYTHHLFARPQLTWCNSSKGKLNTKQPGTLLYYAWKSAVRCSQLQTFVIMHPKLIETTFKLHMWKAKYKSISTHTRLGECVMQHEMCSLRVNSHEVKEAYRDNMKQHSSVSTMTRLQLHKQRNEVKFPAQAFLHHSVQKPDAEILYSQQY